MLQTPKNRMIENSGKRQITVFCPYCRDQVKIGSKCARKDSIHKSEVPFTLIQKGGVSVYEE